MKIIINDQEFRHFARYDIDLKYNSIASTFSFQARNDSVIDYLFDYSDCEIYDDNGMLLITGTIMSPSLVVSPVPEMIDVSGYTKTGVLEDCEIGIDYFPLQFDNLSLKNITDKLLEPFGLNWNATDNVLDDLDKPYTKVSSEIGTSVRAFLNDLASQRNIILTHDELGQLVYTRFESAEPVDTYIEGQWGQKNAILTIDSQQLHSEITVLKEADRDNPDQAQYTIINPYVEKYRPTTIRLNSGDIFDVEKAARNALSAELEGIQIKIETTKFVLPGSTIEFKAPSLGINDLIDLFVQEVNVSGTTSTIDNVVLTCVLTDVYTNDEVVRRF